MSVYGNSASRQARVIRAGARKGARRRVTAWMGVNAEAKAADAVAARWELGARAEKATARLVRPLWWRGWRIRHDRRLAGRRFNVDHVLVSPCGTAVVVADTKRWHARRTTTVVGGRLCCGEDRHEEAEKAARYAALVGQALAAPGVPQVAVWPVLVVHGSTVLGGHVQVATVHGMVQVVAADQARRVLRAAPQGWSWQRGRRVARRVDQVLRPYR
ncbi:nuclease-related domain-containing protein [Streptomyces sp. NPDC005900]|uniref:nuclease-related domain-containing protein n=1 Tax=Streptomyces sp. NPDC005900 TaxID=3154569 RepID=UPI0033D4945D